MATTNLGTGYVYRTDTAGWYADGTGGTQAWGCGYPSGQQRVLRYTISVGSVPYKVSGFSWGSGNYTQSSPNSNAKASYVIATSTQANSIQAKCNDGGLYNLKNGSVTARGTSATGSGSAPSITGLNLTLSANTTYYLYLYGSVTDSYGWSYCTGACTITYTTYTACGAPTSVTASGIVTPSGSFTVSWSGASAGTSNSITGYRVYWYVTSGGTAPTTSAYTNYTDVSSTSTSGSKSITLSSANRGYKVVCGVVTMGAAGASYYSTIKTGGSVTINTLPGAPTLNKSSQTITSGASGVTVTATAGSTGDTGQTASVYYATSTTGTKTKGTSVTINPSKGSYLTYYFWTYDGLEYSSSTSITIKRNSTPTLAVSVSSSSSYKYGSSGTSFTVPTKLSITATKGTYGSNLTVGIKIIYNASGSTPATNLTVESALSITSGTAKAYTIDPQALLKSYYTQTSVLNYRINVTYSDGIESATAVTLPSASTNYIIPARPSIYQSYDQFADSNIGSSGYMCKRARVYWYEDTSVTTRTVSVSGSSSGTISSTAAATGTSSNSRYMDVQLNSNPASHETITITVSLSNSSGITKSFSTTLTTIYIPSFGSISGTTSVAPFNANTSISKSISYPFVINGSAISIADADDNDKYCFNQSDLIFCVANNTSNTSPKQVAGASVAYESGYSIDKDSDTLRARFLTYETSSTKGILDFNKTSDNTHFGISSYAGSANVVGYFKLTNKYGEVFTSGTCTITLNFGQNPSGLSITIDPYNGNDQQTYIQQGLTPKAAYEFTYYTEGQYTIKIEQASNAAGDLTDEAKAALTWTTIYTTTTTALTNTSVSGSSYSVNTSAIDYTYPEITNDNYHYYRLVASISSNSTTKYTGAKAVIKQVAPALVISDFTAKDNPEGSAYGTLATSYDYYLTGLRLSATGKGTNGTLSKITGSISDGTNTIAPYDSDESAVVPADITSTYSTATNYTWSSNGETPWTRSVRYIQIVITVTNTGANGATDYSLTRVFVLEQTSLFINAPTIAYRMNRLGINTAAPKTESVLDIVTSQGHDYVRIQGASNTMLIAVDSGLIAWFSGTSATTPSSSGLLHKIDFINGILS